MNSSKILTINSPAFYKSCPSITCFFACLMNYWYIYIYKYPIIYIIGFNQSYLVDQSFSSPSLSSLPFTTWCFQPFCSSPWDECTFRVTILVSPIVLPIQNYGTDRAAKAWLMWELTTQHLVIDLIIIEVYSLPLPGKYKQWYCLLPGKY